MTTYQRLKKENAELREKLRIVSKNPSSPEAFIIMVQVNTAVMIEASFMFGEHQANKNKTKFNGLLNHITKC